MSDVVAREALTLANAQIQHGVPPILTLGHLAQHFGLPRNLLHDIVKRIEHPYKVYFTRKKNGSRRMIHVPQPFLCSLQRWINAYILQTAAVHPRSYAYKAKCDIVDCAKQHCGAKMLIKMDIIHHDDAGEASSAAEMLTSAVRAQPRRRAPPRNQN